jgi:pumilio family protein 6
MPSQIATFAEIDTIRASTSKKDDNIRADEIRRAASDNLLEFIAQNGGQVARDTAGSLLVTEIMLQTEGGMSFSPF